MNTAKWMVEIDQITNDFKQAFGHLDGEKLNWKPNPGTWSVGQNIDHLITVNNTYFPVIESIRFNTYSTPWLAKIGFFVRFFGKMILGSVQPDRRRKMKTFPIWEPGASGISPDIVLQFEQHQEALKNLMAACSDLLDKGTVISSPANRNIVYKLETAFDIIVAHERRHFEQAKETFNLFQ